jgi:IMP and pyridine-specific 5'-nucleotidase
VELPGNWTEKAIEQLLDTAYTTFERTQSDLNLQNRSRIIRKKRSVGLIPARAGVDISRESLDELVLRVTAKIHDMAVVIDSSDSSVLQQLPPFCAFNGGSDVWVDVSNKRIGVQVLQSFLGIEPSQSLHIGDQFLNTGNDFGARYVAPCI